MPMTPSERRLRGQIAAHDSWAATVNRTARTEPGRRALNQRFLDEAGGDPVRAEHLRRAHFARLALKSVRARRRMAELADEAALAEGEIVLGDEDDAS